MKWICILIVVIHLCRIISYYLLYVGWALHLSLLRQAKRAYCQDLMVNFFIDIISIVNGSFVWTCIDFTEIKGR